jgi:hypothetical protein
VVSHNGDSSPVMCCKDIFLGYVTLPANDKTRRLEYGALAWRLERRLLNVIFNNTQDRLRSVVSRFHDIPGCVYETISQLCCSLAQITLWVITASGSELRSKSMVDTLRLRYDMKRLLEISSRIS